jgi:biotin transport system substrate-specific component
MGTDSRSRAASAAISCLFAALCAAGAFIALPIPGSPVPIVAQNLFVVLAGLLLGPAWGSLAVVAFLLLGALGFPVFSGGRGGLAHFVGPTGGYLLGYLLAAFLSGLIARKRGYLRSILGSVLGFLAILCLGTIRLKLLKNVNWGKALVLGLLPFLPGDAIKAALAALVAVKLGPFVDSLRGTRSRDDSRAA